MAAINRPPSPIATIQADYLRTPAAITFLGIGKTKFWNLVSQGYIKVVKPEGPNSKIGYVSLSELRRYQSGQMAKT